MERSVEPSRVEGKIKAPSSKSMTQRAIAAAMLAEGQTTIINPSYCDDSLAAMSIAVGLGAKVEPGTNELKITGCGELKETKLNCVNRASQSGCSHLLQPCSRLKLQCLAEAH